MNELFKMFLLCGLITYYAGNYCRYALLIAGFSIAAVNHFSGINIISNYLGFFIAGIFLGEKGIKDFYLNKLQIFSVIIIFFLLGQLSISGNVNHELHIALILAVSGIMAVCGISVIIARNNMLPILRDLGKVSMPIFLAHIIFASGIRIIMQKIFGIESFTIHIIAGVLIGIIAPAIIYNFCRKHSLSFIFEFPEIKNKPALFEQKT